MKAGEFVFLCEERALAELGAPPPELTRKLMWTTLQYRYPNPAIHFELQPQPSRGVVELGLHFESDPEVNDLAAATIAAAAGEIIPVLGPDWELEVWTASWRRLHRTFRFEALTARLSEEVGEALAAALRNLSPIIRESGFVHLQPQPVAAPRRARRR